VSLHFFATAAKGTEPALRDELRELRLPRVRCDRGGVHFEGELADGWYACLQSRVAVRVLLELGRFEAAGEQALYDAVRSIDWDPWMAPTHTLAVSAACRSSALTHTGYIAQKTKDAVVDQVRDRVGSRPSVDRHDPDVALFVHLVEDRLTVYLDLAGDSLHRRGYRQLHLEAPLKETLAAACLRLLEWDRRSPLADPMCGSGTLAIEAAMWSRNVAPGLLRERFGFERWPCFGEEARRRMADLRASARAAVLPEGPDVIASDLDPRAVELAAENARRAGVTIVTRRADVRTLAPAAGGAVVMNPPYGQRLEGGPDLYRALGDLVQRMRGHRVGVLCGDPDLERALRARPDRWQAVWNGDIECRFLVFGRQGR
jgi:putative N6-adenine-specific DNA methylase